MRNRFKNDKFIFKENIEVDGVYNAIGVHFYRESNPLEEEKLRLTTVTEFIEPCELFDALLYYKKGHFSIDGLTVKSSIFDKSGYFGGDDIIDLILEKKQCARFICDKVYRYFVNPIVDPRHLDEITTIFFKDYDINNLIFNPKKLKNWDIKL